MDWFFVILCAFVVLMFLGVICCILEQAVEYLKIRHKMGQSAKPGAAPAAALDDDEND